MKKLILALGVLAVLMTSGATMALAAGDDEAGTWRYGYWSRGYRTYAF